MKERYLKATSEHNTSVTFSTIHSVCYSILNSGNLNSNYRLLPEKEKIDFLKKTIIKYQERNRGFVRVPGLINLFLKESAAFERSGLSFDDYRLQYCDREFFKFAQTALQSFKEKFGYFDFDDMAKMSDRLLTESGGSEVIAGKFEFVLVDEFQDTGVDQFKFLKKLCKNDNFYAVGDEDQSIYGFRGACPEIMINFKDYFDDCRIYSLPENYRSTNSIVRRANNLISKNKKRYNKNMVSMSPACDCDGLKIISAYNEIEEMNQLVSEIRKARMSGDSVAVLARTCNILEKVAARLTKENIKFCLKDNLTNIFEHPKVRMIMSFFKAIVGRAEAADFMVILRSAGIQVNEGIATAGNLSWSLLKEVCTDARIRQLERHIIRLKKYSPETALEFIRNVIGVERGLSEYDRGKLDEFRGVIHGLSTIESVFELEENYEVIREKRDVKNAVILSTIHSSKGLEFDRVFVPFVNEGVIPYARAIAENGKEEERRIMYVAMTRARKFLTLSWHETFLNKKAMQSSFIKELEIKKRLDNF